MTLSTLNMDTIVRISSLDGVWSMTSSLYHMISLTHMIVADWLAEKLITGDEVETYSSGNQDQLTIGHNVHG